MPEFFQTAKIVEWNDSKGYGFLQVGDKRVFLHRRDFAERHKRPAVGDVIQFTMGKDAKGRPCAQNAVHVNDGGRITPLALLLLLCLLGLPAYALYRHGVALQWAGAVVLAMGLVSYLGYAADKQRARAKEWRISEAGLHLTELLGGWPGAFLAQRRLRHKVSKPGFQFIFWAIVLGYQLAAYDSLQNWRLSRIIWNQIHQSSGQVDIDSRAPVIEIITNGGAAGRNR